MRDMHVPLKSHHLISRSPFGVFPSVYIHAKNCDMHHTDTTLGGKALEHRAYHEICLWKLGQWLGELQWWDPWKFETKSAIARVPPVDPLRPQDSAGWWEKNLAPVGPLMIHCHCQKMLKLQAIPFLFYIIYIADPTATSGCAEVIDSYT